LIFETLWRPDEGATYSDLEFLVEDFLLGAEEPGRRWIRGGVLNSKFEVRWGFGIEEIWVRGDGEAAGFWDPWDVYI
jgi:hypothetical protein